MIHYLRTKIIALKNLLGCPAAIERISASLDYNARAIVELQGRLDKIDAALAGAPQAARQLQLRQEADYRQLRTDWRATLFTQQQALLAAARALAGTTSSGAERAGFEPAMLAHNPAEPGLTHPCRTLLPEALDAQARTGQAAWLDLACAGGRWLQELTQAGLSPRGVDHRSALVSATLVQGLAAQAGSELHALESANPASLAGVSAFDLIERLAPQEVPKLIEAAWQALAPGGVLMLSGSNPENLSVALFGLWQAPERTRLWLPQTLTEYTRAKGYTHQRELRWHISSTGAPLLAEDQGAPACLQPQADAEQLFKQACTAPDHWALIVRKPV